MSFEQEMHLEEEYVMPTFKRKPVEFVRGSGMHLYDAEGRRYLDFLSGIGVCSLGHCPDVLTRAISEQAQKLIHVSNYFYIEERGEVAARLSELLNAGCGAAGVPPENWKAFFANSGAEANECAIKLARARAKKKAREAGIDPQDAPDIVVTLVNSFHGRTLATLAATGQDAFHVGFEPMPSGFTVLPINDSEALHSLFERMAHRICALLLEPIQGESGVHICTAEYLKDVRRVCDEHDVLMMCDEVQCGIFRTGKPFAFQCFGVVPDVVTIAKGIASGIPAAACCARGEYGDILQPGMHGSTFGGSNIAMAAANATLAELVEGNYQDKVTRAGVHLLNALASLPNITHARGVGLMCAVDLIEEIDATDIVDRALEAGLVINATGPHTLRFLPPLICTSDDIDELAAILRGVLTEER